jgi:FkbM family methyltransferase
MLKILNKIRRLIKRKKNAQAFKIEFTRASKWKLPTTVLIKNKFIDLSLINDSATNTSFIDIFLDDVYGCGFFKNHLPAVKSIIDIGANQGLFTLAAQNFFDAEIHSYEPNSGVMGNLQHHCKQINSTSYNEAVGLKEGSVSMNVAKDSLHGQTFLDVQGTISQISFKTAVQRMNNSVDLLKLDCEGAEWEILKDINTLQCVKAITMEYHTNNDKNHETIKQVLAAANFEIVHHEISGPSWGMAWAIKGSETIN